MDGLDTAQLLQQNRGLTAAVQGERQRLWNFIRRRGGHGCPWRRHAAWQHMSLQERAALRARWDSCGAHPCGPDATPAPAPRDPPGRA